uniref:Uncharacterized protein n=1 Tax=Anopheles stephensi TaxID=30069 RepID=A0A182YRU2_ANOST
MERLLIKRSLLDARVQLLSKTVEEVATRDYNGVSVAVCLKRINDLSTQYVELGMTEEKSTEQNGRDEQNGADAIKLLAEQRTELLKLPTLNRHTLQIRPNDLI